MKMKRFVNFSVFIGSFLLTLVKKLLPMNISVNYTRVYQLVPYMPSEIFLALAKSSAIYISNARERMHGGINIHGQSGC